MVHRLSKQVIVKTNQKNIELDLTRHTNVLQAIRYLINGEADNWFNERNVGEGLRNIITHPRLQSLLTGWYMTENLYPEDVSEEGSFTIVVMFIN